MSDLVKKLRDTRFHIQDFHRKEAADRIEELEAELSKHQESSFHPDWSLLVATRESLKDHMSGLADMQTRIEELEDAPCWYCGVKPSSNPSEEED